MGIVLNADQIGEENDSTRISRHRKKKVHFLVAKLLYKSKWPYIRMSTTFRGKRDFLGP